MICPACPGGYACSGGSNSGCSGTSGARNYFGNTFGSCTQNTNGNFASSHELVQVSCPPGKWAVPGDEACRAVDSSYYVDSDQAGQTQCSTTTQQSATGVGACSYAPVGYYVGSGQGTSGITMRPIPTGYYKSAVSDSDPVSCPSNNECTTTAATGCDAMKYAENGESYCTRVPIGYYVTGSYYSACSQTGYNTVTSACVTCSYMKCDQYTALTQTCPIGFYFASSSTFTCTTCPAGSYCRDGQYKNDGYASWPVPKTGKGERIRCPAGYSCTTSSMTRLGAGYVSAAEVSTGTEVNYMMERDLTGASCPDDSYYNTDRLRCIPTSFGQTASSDVTSQGACSSSG
jgi:hypothetical protein